MSRYRGQLPSSVYWSTNATTNSRTDNSYNVFINQEGNLVIHLCAGLYLSMPVSAWNCVAESAFMAIHDRRVADASR